MKSKTLTHYENILLGLITEAESYIDSDYELEMEHITDAEDEERNGWYAYKYNGSEATPIYKNDYDTQPVISDSSIERFNIDIDAVLRKAKCYVCG